DGIRDFHVTEFRRVLFRSEHGRRVRGVRSDTFPADLRDVAHLAVLLQAETERAAPEVGLVVVCATRIEADVAADRAGIAQLWSRSEERRVGKECGCRWAAS